MGETRGEMDVLLEKTRWEGGARQEWRHHRRWCVMPHFRFDSFLTLSLDIRDFLD